MNSPLMGKRLKTAQPMKSTELRIGLFVSDLDCGWQNTPFLLEGVLLATEADIAIIRTLTSHVTVDPTRSQIDAFPAVYAEKIYEAGFTPVKRAASDRKYRVEPGTRALSAAPALALGARLRRLMLGLAALFKRSSEASVPKKAALKMRHEAHQLAATSSVAPATKAEWFPQYLDNVYAAPEPPAGASLNGRIWAWFATLVGRFVGVTARKPKPIPVARPDFVPENFDLVRYPDVEATVAGIPKALAACEMSEQVLIRVARDIRTNGTIDMPALQSAADTLAENMISRPATMMLAARMRDENDRVYQHGLGVAIYLTMLGRHLGFQREPLAELATIGMLLDLGKMDLDQSLLDKPGALDASERKIMESHVEIGVDKLRAGGVRSDIVLQAIADHHERIDGLGYPNGRTGDQVTIYGKMAAIADGFVAMVGARPYAPTMSTYEALRTLFAEAGTRWHAPLVEQFVQSIGVFPVGSLIELVTGEVAIVVEDNRFRRLEPKILVLTNRDKEQLKAPWSMDMMKHNFSIAPDSVRILRGLADGAYGVNFREFYLRQQ